MFSSGGRVLAHPDTPRHGEHQARDQAGQPRENGDAEVIVVMIPPAARVVPGSNVVRVVASAFTDAVRPFGIEVEGLGMMKPWMPVNLQIFPDILHTPMIDLLSPTSCGYPTPGPEPEARGFER